MELKALLGILSVAIALVVSLSYIYSMVRGKTRPHIYSIAIDAVLTSIVLAGVIVAGAGAGAWNLVVSAVLVWVMVVLCLKYGTRDITISDAFFAFGAALSIALWVITKDPMWSVILASGINMLSVVPTFRKTWNDPHSEPLTIWGLNALKHSVAIGALAIYSSTTLVYPVTAIGMNIVFILTMMIRRTHDPHAPV